VIRRCAGWSATGRFREPPPPRARWAARDRVLTRPEKLAALADLPGQWIDTVHRRRPPRIIVLDMDSSESPTYGKQEGSAYNGHFGCTCYHPLFVFNQLGDLERGALRSGTPQRRRLVRGAGAGDRPLPGHGKAALFPRRRCFRQPGYL